MFETKYCRACGNRIVTKVKQVGYDEQTGKPVSMKLRYCPTLPEETILKAYLDGTLCLSGYYYGHFLEEADE